MIFDSESECFQVLKELEDKSKLDLEWLIDQAFVWIGDHHMVNQKFSMHIITTLLKYDQLNIKQIIISKIFKMTLENSKLIIDVVV